jgi:hypothetical protein
VNTQVEEWFTGGWWPSLSEYANPIVHDAWCMMNKKDGTKRLCEEYRRLIKEIVKDHLNVKDRIDRLSGAMVVSTLDHSKSRSGRWRRKAQTDTASGADYGLQIQ